MDKEFTELEELLKIDNKKVKHKNDDFDIFSDLLDKNNSDEKISKITSNRDRDMVLTSYFSKKSESSKESIKVRNKYFQKGRDNDLMTFTEFILDNEK